MPAVQDYQYARRLAEQGNPNGQVAALPPEIQAQLAGPLPPLTSPEYASLVRAGRLPAPKLGTMEYLDFARANPAMMADIQEKQMAASRRLQGLPPKAPPKKPEDDITYNPFAIIKALLERP